MWNLDYVWRDVNDMYIYTKENSLKLLSDYSAPFWSEYVENYETYDRIFRRMFKHYVFFDQDLQGQNPIDVVTEEFTDDVHDFLFLNDKRFSELYRLHIAQFENNPFYNQYVTQTKYASRNIDSTTTTGEREDSSSTTSGERTDTVTNKAMTFNSSDFVDVNKSINDKGEEEDSSTFTKGEQEDTQNIDETSNHTVTIQGASSNPYYNAKVFKDMWSSYQYYEYIFKEISKELLLILN